MARPRAFEAVEVLDAALQTFQLHGFEATSIDDLVQATGLSRASLYNAFGDKEQLFQAALDRYEERQLARLREKIATAASPRQAILQFLAWPADKEEKLGCLVVNSGMELSLANLRLQSRVHRSLDRIRAILEELLTQMDVEDPSGAASILQSVFLGMRVLARTGTPRRTMVTIAERTIERMFPVR